LVGSCLNNGLKLADVVASEFFIQTDFPCVKLFQAVGHVFFAKSYEKSPAGEGRACFMMSRFKQPSVP
jgi:hypothetical protein